MKNHPSHNKQIASLKRVEGQIRGIINMVIEEKYCVDILYQIKAAKSALVSVESKILENHIESCVKNSLNTLVTSGMLSGILIFRATIFISSGNGFSCK